VTDGESKGGDCDEVICAGWDDAIAPNGCPESSTM